MWTGTTKETNMLNYGLKPIEQRLTFSLGGTMRNELYISYKESSIWQKKLGVFLFSFLAKISPIY
jgi:hypothetical protein